MVLPFFLCIKNSYCYDFFVSLNWFLFDFRNADISRWEKNFTQTFISDRQQNCGQQIEIY
ncbi:hypothetical protein DERP_007574 [Dermatophagoides pteronyssinus]|uniref:Uncharacterized protein n=1 Tax=Dermatophagoides pteronyssinus TaxID=6956 RepID=A0ABQ8JK47_DERPT|nr:hypothetical protein DERP_007574 [Dermatophagoides pteronyssinus]